MSVTRFAGIKTINSAGANVIDRTSPLQMDGNISIGQLPLPLNNSYILTSATLTENVAGGDVSINVAASANAVIGMCCSEYFKQITSFLSTSSVPPINNSGQYADNSGDTPLLKGTMITGFEVSYSVQGGALTSFNFRADLNTFKNAVGNSITSVIANGQNGLSLAATASATTCSVITIPVTAPVFDATDNTELYIRLNPVTPAGVTFRLYSIMMNITFNYL